MAIFMNNQSKFILAKWEELIEKYELKMIFSRYTGDSYSSLFTNKYFLFSDKSVFLEESLFLDQKNCEEWPEKFGIEYK